MAMSFDDMLSQVYSYWPSIIGDSGVGGLCDYSDDIEGFYESKVAPLAQASGSSLIIQLDWIVYGAVCAVLKVSSVVRMSEIRVDYIKGRFHGLLLTVGRQQLAGEMDPDGSFDLHELAVYINYHKLI